MYISSFIKCNHTFRNSFANIPDVVPSYYDKIIFNVLFRNPVKKGFARKFVGKKLNKYMKNDIPCQLYETMVLSSVVVVNYKTITVIYLQ